jgi:hypothetical protein
MGCRALCMMVELAGNRRVPVSVPAQCLWNRRYADVWPILGRSSWSPQCAALAAVIGTTAGDRVLDLISRSYTTIYLKNRGSRGHQ